MVPPTAVTRNFSGETQTAIAIATGFKTAFL